MRECPEGKDFNFCPECQYEEGSNRMFVEMVQWLNEPCPHRTHIDPELIPRLDCYKCISELIGCALAVKEELEK